MKPLKIITFLLVMLLALATSPAKNKKPYKLPALFNQARYVYVEATDGQEFDPRLDPYDRQAIADVDRAIYDWKRYVLTTERNQADLIFVVRKGRLVEGRVRIPASSGPQSIPGRPTNGPLANNGAAIGAEVGPPNDLLEVYEPNPGDTRGTLLWQRTLADGLNPPQLALFNQLKDEVESTYPNQTAPKP